MGKAKGIEGGGEQKILETFATLMNHTVRVHLLNQDIKMDCKQTRLEGCFPLECNQCTHGWDSSHLLG